MQFGGAPSLMAQKESNIDSPNWSLICSSIRANYKNLSDIAAMKNKRLMFVQKLMA